MLRSQSLQWHKAVGTNHEFVLASRSPRFASSLQITSIYKIYRLNFFISNNSFLCERTSSIALRLRYHQL